MAGKVRPEILVFDSGLGGLSILRELVKLYPSANYHYLADKAGFPYGALAEEALVERICALIGRAFSSQLFDLCVIACNTASTLVLDRLRAHFTCPFVGTVPAIKPACQLSQSKVISILATPATVRRDYTRQLIDDFAGDCEVNLVGAPKLAALIESKLTGGLVEDDALLDEISPAFLEIQGRCSDLVVLACTHYPLISYDLERLAPWPVIWLDPAPAIARQAARLLPEPSPGSPSVKLLSTAPMTWPDLTPVLGSEIERLGSMEWADDL